MEFDEFGRLSKGTKVPTDQRAKKLSGINNNKKAMPIVDDVANTFEFTVPRNYPGAESGFKLPELKLPELKLPF